MKKRKRKLNFLLLIPLLLVVLIQGLLPFSILLASRAKETMELNAVEIDSNLAENRRVVLENAMVDQWSAIRSESGYLNNVLEEFLAETHTDINTFLGDKEMQSAYAQRVFPEILTYLQGDDSCGAFLILGNDMDQTVPQDYVGFFLRDSDPTTWPGRAILLWIVPGLRTSDLRAVVCVLQMTFSIHHICWHSRIRMQT